LCSFGWSEGCRDDSDAADAFNHGSLNGVLVVWNCGYEGTTDMKDIAPIQDEAAYEEAITAVRHL
jgi:hypothetical protein